MVPVLWQDWSTAWPATSAWLVLAVCLVLVAIAGSAGWWGWTWWLRVRPLRDDPLPSLADRHAVESLTLPQIVAKPNGCGLRWPPHPPPATLARPSHRSAADGTTDNTRSGPG